MKKNYKQNNNKFIELFFTFAKIGLVTFGGGYAMLPILQREICDDKNWAQEEELLDYYAIGQVTPGIIAINTATFVGRKVAGNLGGIIATLGMVFPSLIIITLIATFFQEFAHLEMVQHALAGVRVCVVALIFHAVYGLAKKAVSSAELFFIFLLIIFLAFFMKINPIISVLTGAASGYILKSVKGSLKNDSN